MLADLEYRLVMGTVVLLSVSSWLFRITHIMYHLYWTKMLARAPRPDRASLLEWMCLGHAIELLKIRGNGGVQILLKQWHEAASNGESVSAFVIWLGPFSPNIILCDAEYAKHVLKHPKIYQKGFVYDAIRYVVPKGITNAEGSSWTRLRKLVTPCFHNRVVESFSDLIYKSAKKRIDGWGANNTINCHANLSQLTLSIILEVTIGKKVMEHGQAREIYQEFGQMMSYTAKCLVSPWRFILGSKLFMLLPFKEHKDYDQQIKRLERVVQDAVQERLQKGSKSSDENSLMEILVNEYEKASSDEYSEFTYKDLSDQLGTFLAAGHDTTASLLSFALYHILKPENREVYDRLVKEADRALSKMDDDTCFLDTEEEQHFSYEDVGQLEYTQAVLKETLRVDTPGPIIAREVVESIQMSNGPSIPRGTSLWIAMSLLHMDPSQWEDPERFNPNRFLSKKPRVGQYLPFSMGNRNCVGQRFAMIEASIILAYLVHTYSLEMVPGQTLVRETAIVNRPSNGIYIKLKPKSNDLRRLSMTPKDRGSTHSPHRNLPRMSSSDSFAEEVVL